MALTNKQFSNNYEINIWSYNAEAFLNYRARSRTDGHVTVETVNTNVLLIGRIIIYKISMYMKLPSTLIE